jgi:hypothetical protein
VRLRFSRYFRYANIVLLLATSAVAAVKHIGLSGGVEVAAWVAYALAIVLAVRIGPVNFGRTWHEKLRGLLIVITLPMTAVAARDALPFLLVFFVPVILLDYLISSFHPDERRVREQEKLAAQGEAAPVAVDATLAREPT